MVQKRTGTELILVPTSAVVLEDTGLAKKAMAKKHWGWGWLLDFWVELHWVLGGLWQPTVQFISTKSSRVFSMEEGGTAIQVDTTGTGTMMIGIGEAIGEETVDGTSLMKMITTETIMKEMSVTRAALLILTVSGVSVSVTMGIRRSGADVRVTGVLYHKQHYSSTGPHHSTPSSHAAAQWTVCPWT